MVQQPKILHVFLHIGDHALMKFYLKEKIRFVMLPFLVISAGYVVAYSLLNWLLCIRLLLFQVDGDLTDFVFRQC